MSQVLEMFNAAGSAQFSKMVCQMAPYFGTIEPEVVGLRPGRAGPRRRSVFGATSPITSARSTRSRCATRPNSSRG